MFEAAAAHQHGPKTPRGGKELTPSLRALRRRLVKSRPVPWSKAFGHIGEEWLMLVEYGLMLINTC